MGLYLDVQIAAGAQECDQPASIGAIEARHDVGDGIVRALWPHASKVAHGGCQRNERCGSLLFKVCLCRAAIGVGFRIDVAGAALVLGRYEGSLVVRLQKSC